MRGLGKLLIVVAVAAGLASPAAAQGPFVTVTGDPDANEAWWIRDMVSRPRGVSVAGVPLARINAALGRGQARWCQAEAFTNASFTSPQPAIRAQIAASLREWGSPFTARTRMSGRPLDAIVGNYRACNGRVAPFLLLVDRSARVPRVAYVRAMSDWTPFIGLQSERGRLIVRSCFECDHAEALTYDRRRGRFVWRNLGD